MSKQRDLQAGTESDSCPEKLNQEDFSNTLVIVAGMLIVAWIVFTVHQLSVFRRLKMNCILLRNRFTLFVYLQVFGAAFQLVWAIEIFITREKLPCSFYVTFPLSIMALQAVPYVVRLLLFHNRIALNQMLARSVLLQAKRAKPDSKFASQPSLEDEKTSSSLRKSQISGNWFPRDFRVSSGSLNMIHKLRFLSSTSFGIVLYVLGVCAWIGYSIPKGIQLRGCFGCNSSEFDYFEMYAAAVLILIVTFILIFRVRNEPDPMKIKADLLFGASSAFLGISFWVLAFLDPGDLQTNGSISWMLGWCVTGFFLVYGLLGFPVWILDEKRRSRELVTGSDNELERILNSRAGRDLLQVQMMNELNVEHFFFYLETIAWQKLFRSKNPNEVQIRVAKDEIVSKYFAKDAAFAINISFEHKTAVLDAGDAIDEHVFDDTVAEVKDLITTDVLPRFRATKAYKEVFLTEQL